MDQGFLRLSCLKKLSWKPLFWWRLSLRYLVFCLVSQSFGVVSWGPFLLPCWH